MGRIREDLVGVVSVGGVDLFPGDEVPEGVAVGDHVLAAEPVKVEKSEPVGVEVPKRRARPSKSEE